MRFKLQLEEGIDFTVSNEENVTIAWAAIAKNKRVGYTMTVDDAVGRNSE